MNNVGRTSPAADCTALPSRWLALVTCPTVLSAGCWSRRGRLSIVVLVLVGAMSVSAPRPLRADWSDLFASADSKKAKVKKPVKKPTSATSRMVGSVMSGPNKLMSSSMSALAPAKKPAPSKYKSVPHKMVAEKKPSLWKKLTTPTPPKRPETVSEWIAQPRPKP